MKLSGDRVLGPSELKHKMGKTIYKTFQATAEYNKTIGEHTFGILAGYSWEQEDYRYVQGSRDKFPGNDLPYLNAGSPDNQKSEGTGNAWAIQSGFGRLRYNFNERYLFESTVRYDGSSRFPQSKKFGFFPSVAAGWRLSEENFFKENESLGFISNLKLKVSWGRLGNQNIGNYPYQSVYELGQNYPFGDTYTQGAAVTTAVDPTIKWEETETIDGGLEAVFWNGLLSVNASYFNRRTYDILYKPSGSVSTILGQKISEMNTGELKNFGWEFEVGHRNKIGDVSYNVNANLSIIKNKLTTLGVGNVEQLNGMVGNGSDLFIGYPIQMYYGYVSDGVFLDENDIKSWYDQSKVTPNPQPGDIRYRDLNNDGKIDVNDVTYIGFPETPRVTYGFSGFVNYSNFEFSFAFQGSGKRSFFMDPSELSPFVDDHAMLTAIYKDHWSEDNMIRKPFWPRLSTQNLIEHSPEEDWYNKNATEVRKSTYFMRECRFLRCTSLELAYNMPKKLMERWGLQNMKFFVRANNPFLISNFKLWDVELGEDAFNYPIQKTYTVGLNFSF